MKNVLLKLIVVLLAGCTIIACAPTVEVTGNFPEPLISPLPFKGGVYYPEDFRNYTYTETASDREQWTVAIGNAQVALYDRVLGSLFSQLLPLEQGAPWDEPLPVDLVITPQIKGFEYTVPSETNNKVYEVQIRYALEIYSGDGSLIADWILNAYGKTPAGFIQSNEDAMEQAVIMAMRDAGARLSLSFVKIPEMVTWLNERQQTAQNTTGEPTP